MRKCLSEEIPPTDYLTHHIANPYYWDWTISQEDMKAIIAKSKVQERLELRVCALGEIVRELVERVDEGEEVSEWESESERVGLRY